MTVSIKAVATASATLEASDQPAIDGGTSEPLGGCIKDALDSYFLHLGDQQPSNLYDLVLGVVEKPLFESVLSHTRGNQTRAAQVLGISRSTLRKKIAALGID